MYEIVITETKEVTKTKVGDFVEVGKIVDPDFLRNEKTKYEYLPDRKITTMEDFEIFRQRVEALDLVRVIAAINKKGK